MAIIDQAVLTRERDALKAECDTLSNQISSLKGEIKAHLSALGITESDVEKASKDAQEQLTKAESEFNALYAEYEKFKAQQAQPVQQGVVTPTQQPTQQPFVQPGFVGDFPQQ